MRFAFLLLWVAHTLATPPPSVPVVHVSSHGVPSLPCGSASTPCSTLQLGARALPNAGGTLAVSKGNYECGFHTNKPIRVVGASMGDVKLDCHGERGMDVNASSVWLQNLHIIGGVTPAQEGGGGVRITLPTLSPDVYVRLDHVHISNCVGSLGAGGVLVQAGADGTTEVVRRHDHVGRAQFIFSECNFVNNSQASSRGAGGLALDVASPFPMDATWTNCQFANNFQQPGAHPTFNTGVTAGALAVIRSSSSSSNTNLTLSRCTFSGQHGALVASGMSAGAMLVAYMGQTTNASLDMSECRFEGNDGGVMRSSFSSFFAGAGGLAVVYAEEARHIAHRVTNSTFLRNSGGTFSGGSIGETSVGGGAMCICTLSKAEHATATVERVAFEDNSGGFSAVYHNEISQGGAGASALAVVYGDASTHTKHTISGCTFHNNRDGGTYTGMLSSGGAIILHVDQQQSSRCIDELNVIEDCVFTSNSGLRQSLTGGGTALVIAAVDPYSQVATRLHTTIRNCMFMDNYGGAGATSISTVMVSMSGRQLTTSISGTSLVNNSFTVVPRQTAAPLFLNIDNGVDNEVAVTNCRFAGNHLVFPASHYDLSLQNVAGALYAIVPSSPVTVRGCTFEGNTGCASGALYAEDGMMYVQDSVFTGNNAFSPLAIDNSCSGGGLTVKGGSVQADNATFKQNTAKYAGGGIAVLTEGSLKCTRCHLAGNSANFVGSDLWVQSLRNNSFIDSLIDMGEPKTEQGNTFDVATQPLSEEAQFTMRGVRLSCPVGCTVKRLVGAVRFISYGCVFCPSNTYSLRNGSSVDGMTSTGCEPCPFGARCDGSNKISALGGFWGCQASLTDSVAFTPCPPGYCCDERWCSSYDTCTGHRMGVLCGECESGYSAVVGSPECRKNSECGDAGWFIPTVIVLQLVVAMVLLYATPRSSGHITVIVYFYQLVGPVLGSDDTSDALRLLVTHVFDFRLTSGARGVCLAKGLSTVSVVALDVLGVAGVGVILCLLYICYSLFGWHHRGATTLRSDHTPDAAWDSKLWVADFRAAATRLLLLAYSVVAKITFQLLHCVPVQHVDGLRLFTAGSVECFRPWQLFLMFVMAVLFLAPVVAIYPVWQWWRQQRAHIVQRSLSHPYDPSQLSSSLSILVSPFKSRYFYWEFVLLAHRLILITLFTFLSQHPMPLQMVLVVVSCCMLALHVSLAPFRVPLVNWLETLLLASLALLALLATPQAFVYNSAQPTSTPVASIIDTTNTLQSILIFLPLLGGGLAFALVWWQRLCGRGVAGRRPPTQHSPHMALKQTRGSIGDRSDLAAPLMP